MKVLREWEQHKDLLAQFAFSAKFFDSFGRRPFRLGHRTICREGMPTARLDGRLIGVSRAITDFAYCTYLSDLAVDVAHQRQGIGRELIRRTHEAAGLHTTVILLSAPKAQEYYPHIGMTKHDSCWITPRVSSKGSTP